MRTSTFPRLIFVVSAIAAAACAPQVSEGATQTIPVVTKLRIQVRNLGWADVRVYAVRNGLERRLGLVTHMNNQTFWLSRDMIPHSTVQLRLAPVGTLRSYTIDPILVGPEQGVHVTVLERPEQSIVFVRPDPESTRAGTRRF